MITYLLFYQVHMEADRKATSGDTNNMPTHFEEKITYRIGSKVKKYVKNITMFFFSSF